MSHLDEGQLHALLDGELDPAERQAAEAHLADCAECRLLYEEARTFLAQADELIAEIQLPPASRPATLPPPLPVPKSGRRLPWNYLAWAATVMLAVGLGWYGSELRYRRNAAAPERSAMAADKLGQTQAAPSPAESAALVASPAAKQAGGPPPAARAVPSEPAVQKSQAVRELADASQPPAEAARDQATGRAESGQIAPAPSAAPAPAAPLAEGQVSSQDRFLNQDRSGERPAPTALAAGREAQTAGLRRVDLAVAVRMLGGTIRLVDGLTPTAVLAGPGGAVSGADPEADLVRVVYDDPPGRELWLDQQRSAGREEADRRAGAARAPTALLPGDTLVTPGKGGVRSLRWLDQGGFRLGLTGFLPADSLQALARRVQ